MSEPSEKPSTKAIPDQLLQIAKEQEGGAEQVIIQIEIVQRSFEEIQALSREIMEALMSGAPLEELREGVLEKLESIQTHGDNGLYNVQGVFDIFQYQDIVRQKLEKVGHRLIEVSQYVLNNLAPADIEAVPPAAHGREILTRDAQMPDVARNETDAIIAEFFAKLRAKG